MATPKRPLSRLTVLYVEDEPKISENILLMLSRRYEKVLFAANGKEGLEKFILHRPDIVVTDIRMPEMDGLELTREIRKINPLTPIVITTAYNETEYLLSAIDAGVDQFVMKPIDFDRFEQSLLKAGETVRLERELRIRGMELEHERNELKRRNDMLESQIAMARKIQHQLMPEKSPDKRIAFHYQPMEKVGGDFYDFLPTSDENCMGIFISDTSGHGVPAAFITTMIKSFLLQNEALREDPPRLLFELNDFLIHQTGGNFVTAFYGIYDFSRCKLTFSSAGHNLPFFIFDGRVSLIPSDDGKKGFPLAVESSQKLEKLHKGYYSEIIDLPGNSRLVFYTDGLTEAVEPGNSELFFEDNGLLNSLKKIEKLSCVKGVELIYRDLVRFRGSESFEDDVCLICLEC